MAQTTPPTVDPLPPAPNTSSPSTFAALADAFLAALLTFRTQLVALAANVYNNAVDAFNNANIAKAQADAALAAVGTTVWVSGTTYTAGQVRYSPVNFLNYRRTTNGAGTTDPSLDAANWTPPQQLGLQGVIMATNPAAPVVWTCPNGVKLVEYELVDGGYSSSTSSSGAAPGGPGGNGGRGAFVPTVGVSYTLAPGAGGVAGGGGTNLSPVAGGPSTISGAGLTTVTSANATIKISGGAPQGSLGLGGASMMSVFGAPAPNRIGAGGANVGQSAPGNSGTAGAVIIRY